MVVVAADFHRGHRAPLRTRLEVLIAWERIDRELAHNPGPELTGAQELRARQLVTPHERRAIAAVLANALDVAEVHGSDELSAGHLRVADILAAREQLRELIGLLRSEQRMPAVAVARAELLACSRAGPLFSPGSIQQAARAIVEIHR